MERLVHISTAMAYGYPEGAKPFTEDAKAGPHAAEYTRTKHLGDEAVWDACAQRKDLAVSMLFLGCVSGPGDTFSVGRPAAVYKDYMAGKIPMLVGPDTKYVYVHIRDVQYAIGEALCGERKRCAVKSF